MSDLLRSSRLRHGLTQHEIAARTGIAQANIAALERRAGPKVSYRVVDRVLRAVGEQLLAVPSRAPSVETTAVRVANALRESKPDRALRAALVFSDGLAQVEPALRCALCALEPASTGDVGWDAFLAGIVDYRIPRSVRPSWTSARVANEWFIDPNLPESVRRIIRDETPSEFRSHGVWVSADDLASV